MKLYAVIDTNVIVSALLTKNSQSPTRVILDSVFTDKVTPLLNPEILAEYKDVLLRAKFRLSEQEVQSVLDVFSVKGEICCRISTDVVLPDQDDLVFYETYLACDESYLVTGNRKHFPLDGKIVSPSDMVHILCQIDRMSDGILTEPHARYTSDSKKEILQRALEAIERIRLAAIENGTADMTMEEIDEEIRKYREA